MGTTTAECKNKGERFMAQTTSSGSGFGWQHLVMALVLGTLLLAQEWMDDSGPLTDRGSGNAVYLQADTLQPLAEQADPAPVAFIPGRGELKHVTAPQLQPPLVTAAH